MSWRHVKVTDRHTGLDHAQVLKELSVTHFPRAKKIVLVRDNLNTHKPASLHEAFPAGEACRLVERFEWHHTPKHGSRLDMSESELSVQSGRCLDRRIPDKQNLIEEVVAWEVSRNKNHAKADWQFTPADARVKLKRLYPTLRTTRGTTISRFLGDGHGIPEFQEWNSVCGAAYQTRYRSMYSLSPARAVGRGADGNRCIVTNRLDAGLHVPAPNGRHPTF